MYEATKKTLKLKNIV